MLADAHFVWAISVTTIKFKTSRTLLQNLFPTQSYSFASFETVAYGSYIQMMVDRMDWLRGQAITTYFGWYIHGVQYKNEDGSVLNGNYLPVTFENLADPILSGREEIGLPKLYSEIEVNRAANSYSMKASWRRTRFEQLELKGLQDYDPSASCLRRRAFLLQIHSRHREERGYRR